MNRAEKTTFTLEIPVTRKAFWDWYNNDQNKRTIYYIALIIWVVWLLEMITILTLTATNIYRSAFYVPLVIFGLVFGPLTHWFIQCSLNKYDVEHRERYHTITLEIDDHSTRIDINNPNSQ